MFTDKLAFFKVFNSCNVTRRRKIRVHRASGKTGVHHANGKTGVHRANGETGKHHTNENAGRVEGWEKIKEQDAWQFGLIAWRNICIRNDWQYTR